ncbi:hypothetical protein HJG60_008813 [Phyllostomus discolor]|uniref:Uncharacterized protein n=1 Tax=Phyllostomus discolor TaxID=89673 RepID=A0A833YWI9_9CHIR|nr:hypothetical protein HJG60_008813 [Phyllostomus discolor]
MWSGRTCGCCRVLAGVGGPAGLSAGRSLGWQSPLPHAVRSTEAGPASWQASAGPGQASSCRVPAPLASTGLAASLPAGWHLPSLVLPPHSPYGEGTGPLAASGRSHGDRGESWPGTWGRVPWAQSRVVGPPRPLGMGAGPGIRLSQVTARPW